jgi:hypothetical protein
MNETHPGDIRLTIDLRTPPPPPPPGNVAVEALTELKVLMTDAPPAPQRLRVCPACDEPMVAYALSCPGCGVDMRTARPRKEAPQRSDRLSRVVAAVARSLLFGLMLAAAAKGSYLLLAGDSIAPKAATKSALQKAAAAEEFFEIATGSITRNVDDLESQGLRLPPGVELAILKDQNGYCIEARHDQLAKPWHISRGSGQPARGRCP